MTDGFLLLLRPRKAEFAFRFFGTFFREVFKDPWERRRKRRPGAISAPGGAPTEPQGVSAFGDAPSLPPSVVRPPSGRRGSTHSARRSDCTRRHASARFAFAETVQPRFVYTLRRECSAGRRPSIVLRFTTDDTRQRNRGILTTSIMHESSPKAKKPSAMYPIRIQVII